MSTWLPDGTAEWQGRLVARKVIDAGERRRAVLTGTVRSIVVHRQHPARGRIHPMAHGLALDAWLDDGSGTITLRWLGRAAIAGVVVGAGLHVEGTVGSESTRLVILNPLYRFVATEPVHDAAVETEVRAEETVKRNGKLGARTKRQAGSSTS